MDLKTIIKEKLSNRKLGIRQKLLIPMIGILLPILITGFFLFYITTRSNELNDIDELSLYKFEIIHGGIKNISANALALASSFASIQGVEKAYAMKEEAAGRVLIRKLTDDYIRNVATNLGIKKLKVHYHKPPARSFVRLWRKPGEKDGGDDISKFRNSVLEISKNHKPITSIEIGRGGPEIRGIAPILHNGEYLGSVEVLSNFHDINNLIGKNDTLAFFVTKKMSEIINEKSIMDKMKTVGDYVYISSSNDKFPDYLDPEKLKASAQGKILRELKGSRYIAYSTVKDYNNNLLGALVLSIDISKNMAALHKTGIFLAITFTLISIFLIIIIYTVVSRLIGSLNVMVESIKRTSEGDMTHDVSIMSGDEIEIMADHYNNFLTKVRDVILALMEIIHKMSVATEQMSHSTDHFNESFQTQASSTEQITATLEEISATTDNIDYSAREQSESVADLINGMDKLSKTITNMSGDVGTVLAEIKKLSDNLLDGETSLKDMSESMTNIRNSSDEMNNIINIINDISDKINLLSLNAAIEAARAGESGRGFAVVADEISKLADQTSASIGEIDKLIKSNEQDISRGMTKTGEIVELIQKIVSDITGVKVITDNMSLYMNNQLMVKDDVLSTAVSIKEKSERIENSTSEHKLALEDVTKSISYINEMIQKSTQESETLTHMGKEIAQSNIKLVEMSRFFKVRKKDSAESIDSSAELMELRDSEEVPSIN